MAKHSAPFYPRLARPATPSFEIDDDPDDLMVGSDFEGEQQGIHRSRASTSFTNATRRRVADAHAGNSRCSSTSRLTPATGEGAAPTNALPDSITLRRASHRAEAFSVESATGAVSAGPVSAGPSNPTSRSPSGLFSASSGDEDEDEYLPGDSEDEEEGADGTEHGTESILQRSPQVASGSTCRTGQNRYTHDEDAVLRGAVEQHGTRWKAITRSYNQLSRGITRSQRFLQKRWRALLKSGKVHPDARARQAKLWTPEETSVLLKSLRLRRREGRHPPYSEHLEDFRKAFPKSARSDRGIHDKCYQMYQEQVERGRLGISHSHRSTTSLGRAGASASSSTALEDPTPATRGSPFASSQEQDRVSVQASSTSDELPVDLDNPAHSLTLGGERCPISPPGTASTQGNASSSMLQAQPQPQRQPQQQTNQQRQPQASQAAAQPLDANVLIKQKSVCIENCPRDAHIAIYTETLVKITREAPPPTIIAFGTSYEAAFHFYVRPMGAIRALRLPEDTTTDVTPVPPGESCDGGTYIDTMFTGPDDYVVLFRSRL